MASKIGTFQIQLGSVCKRRTDFLGWRSELCGKKQFAGNEKRRPGFFFYHSNEGLEIVGIAKVVKEAYQDPTTDEEAWVVVDLKPVKEAYQAPTNDEEAWLEIDLNTVKKLKNPVSLKDIKEEKSLQNMDLLRLGRLSVGTVKDDEWKLILKMAGEK